MIHPPELVGNTERPEGYSIGKHREIYRVIRAKNESALSEPSQLLSEVIRNMIARQPDMEVMGEVIDPI